MSATEAIAKGGLSEMLRESIALAQKASLEAYKAGHAEGYRLGFREGVAEAKKIIDEHFAPVPPP